MNTRQKFRLCRLGLLASTIGVGVLGNMFWYKAYLEEKKQKEKNVCLKQLFIKWLDNEKNKIKISDYLNEMNIKTIAIYGMSDAGWKLYDELKQSDIVVEYVIDRRMIEADIELVTIDDELKDVDLIIVTAIYDYDEIANDLKKKTQSQVISLEQIIYEAESYCV